MIAPRWRKVLADVLGNPTRTILVVLSIAVGIVAVGMVTGAYVVIGTDLPQQYGATNPAHARLFTGAFDEDLVRSVRRLPGVEDAEGERRMTVQAQIGPSKQQELRLFAIDEFDRQRIATVAHEAGQWPPGKQELLVERASLDVLGVQPGDDLTVKLGDDRLRTLKVVGLTHDLNEIAANFTGVAYGYVNFDTLEWLGAPRNYNQLELRVVERQDDRAHIEAIAQQAADKMEKAGVAVGRVFVPEPGKHQMEQFLTPMLLILGAMGALSLLLSGFLVVNIISALLTQQTRQIGVMKTLGARAGQITAMYLATVLFFGLLALAIAIPAGVLATNAFTDFAAGLMNFDVLGTTLPPQVLILEVVVGIAAPLLAALYPVRRGAAITVREAITDYGIAASALRRGWVDVVLERVRGLSRPQLISLRNTFRRRGRLFLTLTTLTLASAIFISVFSVRSSLARTMQDSFSYWNYDVTVDFNRSYRAEYLAQAAEQLPGVMEAEAWGFRNTTRIRPDDTVSDNILLIAPQIDTQMIRPTLLEGRWLMPDDENAVVINTDLLDDEPDLRVGDELVLDMDDREIAWQIVGLVRSVMSGPFAYANYPYFSRITRNVGQANSLNVALVDRSEAAQFAAAQQIESAFKSAGLSVSSVRTTADRQARVQSQFDVLITFLAIMALLLAVVGGLGLMGAMSINVLERRREVGVMRAIGASTPAVMKIVVGEGMIIGLLSWVVGALLAIPLSKVLSDAVGAGFINSALTYQYSLGGAGFWLAVVLGVAAFASFLPAHSAARLTVREVLAYE
jgi:putative ABC transport system permease protein